MEPLHRLTVAAIFACVLLVFAPFCVLIPASLIADEFRDYHNRQAVRAALRGDCPTAISEAGKAGRVSYDVHRYCLSERPQ